MRDGIATPQNKNEPLLYECLHHRSMQRICEQGVRAVQSTYKHPQVRANSINREQLTLVQCPCLYYEQSEKQICFLYV